MTTVDHRERAALVHRADDSLGRLGGTCAIALGLSYILLAVVHVLLPEEQQGGGASPQFFLSFARAPQLLMLQYAVAALGAGLAFAAVPAISGLVRRSHEELVRWMATLAYIGFGAVLLDSVRFLAFEPARAALFAAEPPLRAAILANDSLLYLDAQGWFGFGGVGLWILAVSLLLLRDRLVSRILAYVGLCVALAYWLVVVGFVLQSDLIFQIAAGAGGIVVGPLWYTWLGLILRKRVRR